MSDSAGENATEPRYPFVAIDASPDDADERAAALFELGATGVEERDDKTLARGSAAGLVTLIGSFTSHDEALAAIEALGEAFEDGDPRLVEVVGDAWRDAWKEHFAPFALTPDITITPPWLPRPEVAAGVTVLELEPGRAFGTGLHATTSLVATILHAHAAKIRDLVVLDVGTGSGILALVALTYGAARAIAIDIDPDVIEIVRENAERNGLADRVEAFEGTIDVVTRAFPVVLANIEARVLHPIAPDLAEALLPGGLLVLSGVLGSEEEAIKARYAAQGLAHLRTERRDDPSGDAWVALAFTRSA